MAIDQAETRKPARGIGSCSVQAQHQERYADSRIAARIEKAANRARFQQSDRALSALKSSERNSIRVIVSNAQGRAVRLTKELLLESDAQQELIPIHAKESVVKADLG